MAILRIPDAVVEDLRALPSEQLQRVALQWIARLRRTPLLGAALEWRHNQHLSRCRKLYFDEDDRPNVVDLQPRKRSEEGARFRIVYVPLPSDDDPATVLVLAVGAKYAEPGVYPTAADRQADLLDDQRGG